MDTGTHLVMGLGLFGLAHLDSNIAADPHTAQAVLFGTVIGSQIPDIDTLYRLKGNHVYIRNHRGWTHSIPMLFLWPVMLCFFLWCFYSDANILSVIGWTTLAVWLHVFVDLFNSYGTQVTKPFSNRWIHFHILHIFDPFLFSTHVIGLLLWWFHIFPPGSLFLTIYILFFLYLGWRSWEHYQKLQFIRNTMPNATRHTILPTYKWNFWYVIVEKGNEVELGELRGKQLIWKNKMTFSPFSHPACIKSKEAPSVAAFLSFSSYGYPHVIAHNDGYEVRWLDVRYFYKKHFSCYAVALLNRKLEVEHSFVGWMSHQEMCKKVEEAKLTLSG